MKITKSILEECDDTDKIRNLMKLEEEKTVVEKVPWK